MGPNHKLVRFHAIANHATAPSSANNRLTGRTNATGFWAVYRYDPVGNLTNIVYSRNHAITLAYDALNRLTNMVDAVGTTVYAYDAVGEVLSEDGPWVDDTVSLTYANRLRTGMSVLAPDAAAWTQTYTYDDENQLVSVYVTNVWESDFVYDGKMRLRERFESVWIGGTRVTNAVTLYVYDGNMVVQERNANNLPAMTYTRGMRRWVCRAGRRFACGQAARVRDVQEPLDVYAARELLG
jgi:YD repeat-containing protein